jgi:hypothetical protein
MNFNFQSSTGQRTLFSNGSNFHSADSSNIAIDWDNANTVIFTAILPLRTVTYVMNVLTDVITVNTTIYGLGNTAITGTALNTLINSLFPKAGPSASTTADITATTTAITDLQARVLAIEQKYITA